MSCLAGALHLQSTSYEIKDLFPKRRTWPPALWLRQPLVSRKEQECRPGPEVLAARPSLRVGFELWGPQPGCTSLATLACQGAQVQVPVLRSMVWRPGTETEAFYEHTQSFSPQTGTQGVHVWVAGCLSSHTFAWAQLWTYKPIDQEQDSVPWRLCFHPSFPGTISEAKAPHSTSGLQWDLTELEQRLAGQVTCIRHEGYGREGPQENFF